MRLSLNNTGHKVTRSQGHKNAAGHKRILLVACGVMTSLLFMGMASIPNRKGVFIQKLKNNNYRLIVDRKPFIIKGVCYNPIPIGSNHEYDWWSDLNKPWIVDGKLMQDMGVNTVRVYKVSDKPENVKAAIRDLYNLYGIHTILGSWLGFWEYPCPLYGDKAFQEKIRKEVLDMVRLYKDEPGVLMWVLGNENNYSCLGRVNPWSTDEIDKETNPQKQNAICRRLELSRH